MNKSAINQDQKLQVLSKAITFYRLILIWIINNSIDCNKVSIFEIEQNENLSETTASKLLLMLDTLFSIKEWRIKRRHVLWLSANFVRPAQGQNIALLFEICILEKNDYMNINGHYKEWCKP